MLLGAVLAISLSVGLAAAAPHRFKLHPEPSLLIHAIAEGPDGLLWLGTADGLYRFDGFHYRKIPEFPFASARKLVSTTDGSLWIGSRDGLARYRSGFEVLLGDEVIDLVAHSDSVIAKMTLRDHIRLRLDNSMQPLQINVRRDLMVDPIGRVWGVCGVPMTACWLPPGQFAFGMRRDAILPGQFLQVIRDRRNRLWAADQTRGIALDRGRQVLEFHRPPAFTAHRASPLLSGRNGQLWFLGEVVRGTDPELVFQDRAALKSFDITAGYEDIRGHLWLALSGRGLMEWDPGSDWERWFPEDLGAEAPLQTAGTKGGDQIAVTRAALYRLNRASREWQKLPRATHPFIFVSPQPNGEFLASVREKGVVRLSALGGQLEQVPNILSTDNFSRILTDRKGRIWIAHGMSLLKLAGQPGAYHLEPVRLPAAPGRNDHVTDLQIDSSGLPWVGYGQGIAYLDERDQWQRLPVNPMLAGILSLAGPDGSDIWASYQVTQRSTGQGGGRFARLRRRGLGWIPYPLGTEAGFSSADTSFVNRDSRGWIWRGTNDGVYVSNGTETAPGDWLHLNPRNGLATQETRLSGFFEDREGSVWITGDQGVTRIHPDAAWFDAPRAASPPRLTAIEADGVQVGGKGAIPAGTKALRIHIGSIHASPLREYPFQYRLTPRESDWRPSRDGTIEWNGLADGAYTLEARYSGPGAAAGLSVPLRVGSGWSFPMPLWMLAAIAGGLGVFARRLRWLDPLTFRIARVLYRFRERTTPAPPGNSNDEDIPELAGGRYQVVDTVSRGGFSTLYEARDTRDGSARLAVKVLNVDAGNAGWVRERFAQEVAALRTIDHPGVIRITDSWVAPNGQPCFVMPFLEGPTLRAAMRAGEVTPQRAAGIIRQIGAALAEAHRAGIVHRDVKPENVILQEEQAVLIDFGAAGLRGPHDQLAETTLLSGSFYYLAPERLTGRYSPASDVYSLSVMILEMLAGKRLDELAAVFGDEGFRAELARLFEPAAGTASGKLAEMVSAAFDPQPSGRPKDVEDWAKGIGELIER